MPPVRGDSSKWVNRASAAAGDYRQGVRSPRRKWAEATMEAAETYAAAVQEALQEGRYARGVEASGDQYWAERSATVGSARFADGVRAGQKNYEEGFRPYRKAIEGLELPPRGKRGSSENYDRVRAVGETLHQTRRAIKRGQS